MSLIGKCVTQGVGGPQIRLDGLTPDQFAAIGKVSTTTRGDATKVEISLLDKKGALVDLGPASRHVRRQDRDDRQRDRHQGWRRDIPPRYPGRVSRASTRANPRVFGAWPLTDEQAAERVGVSASTFRHFRVRCGPR
jgi:hypothetical protein